MRYLAGRVGLLGCPHSCCVGLTASHDTRHDNGPGELDVREVVQRVEAGYLGMTRTEEIEMRYSLGVAHIIYEYRHKYSVYLYIRVYIYIHSTVLHNMNTLTHIRHTQTHTYIHTSTHTHIHTHIYSCIHIYS